jgi:UDP-N-acetylglucosamine--N-acetylmuramyl-(pentapeptide) pyrophosphoryl-undecaprenol N-acetylglucosamine transferase
MPEPLPYIAIACGGTGGHLYPGIAIAEALQRRDFDVLLLISPKEVDQSATRSVIGMDIETLPAVGLSAGGLPAFARGFWRSLKTSRAIFKRRPPQAVLAMGGFTSAPPIIAAKSFRAATFIHEANSIPGRANRWLAPWVGQAFVYFPMATRGLRQRKAFVTGMPVRSQFQVMDPGSCRQMLGLQPDRPVLLIMGGSQGASGINELTAATLPLWAAQAPHWQYLHLTGAKAGDQIRQAYERLGLKAVVRPFLTEMELALNAATAAISRSGASSLAELAAMRVPSLLIPYPTAADNHQFHNAMAFVETGSARMVTQSVATPQTLASLVFELMENRAATDAMRSSLAQWHRPNSAEEIAGRIATALGGPQAIPSAPGSEPTSLSTHSTPATPRSKTE